jgi:hypothetical protein
MNFITSEAIGILGGLSLIMLGIGIGEWAGVSVLPRKKK